MDNFFNAAIAGLMSLNIASASSANLNNNPDVQKPEVLGISQPIKTETRFEEKFATDSATIKFDTEYKDDPETEAGTETIVQEGEEGKKVTTTKITYYLSDKGGKASFCEHELKSSPAKCEAGAYNGGEFDRDIVSVKTEDPKNKIISRGTKIIWKTLQTPEGEIKYWKKMRVYATHYDSRCPGCNDWTAIGMRAGKGVIAVDPKVIKMRSQVYIPGYGKAVAGDTGGAIKGNIIDLGFDDARTAGWRAQYIDIYLL